MSDLVPLSAASAELSKPYYWTLYRAARGDLDRVHHDGHWFVSRASLDAFKRKQAALEAVARELDAREPN